ncbi:hypothetical protein GGI42DRAFT_317921 [Trichoderma sp. SZMC 28013]
MAPHYHRTSPSNLAPFLAFFFLCSKAAYAGDCFDNWNWASFRFSFFVLVHLVATQRRETRLAVGRKGFFRKLDFVTVVYRTNTNACKSNKDFSRNVVESMADSLSSNQVRFRIGQLKRINNGMAVVGCASIQQRVQLEPCKNRSSWFKLQS